MSERSEATELRRIQHADARETEEPVNEHSSLLPVESHESGRRANRVRAVDRDVEPQLAALLRIETLLTVLAKQSIRPLLEQELSDPIARKIYEATGEKTARTIADQAGVGIGTVSRTWSRWEGLGIVTKEGTRYRRAV